MKNSEWGAVAYLAHSQYGRNGFEVDINNSSYYITGNGSNSTTSTTKVAGVANAYNTEIGAHASTTGNIYGVYDMSGGAYECVATFNTKDTKNYYARFATSFATTTNPESDEYATLYDNQTTSSSGHKTIYSVGKVGDATKEVSSTGRYASTSTAMVRNWFSDYPNVCTCDNPFFCRDGGGGGQVSDEGLFSSKNFNGNSGVGQGFRVVLCP